MRNLGFIRDIRKALKVQVFTRTKHGANRLCRQLERDGLAATAIHRNKSQAARARAPADFKNNKVPLLVATSHTQN